MKRFLIVLLAVIVLAACTDGTPTPTESPIITPESPLATPGITATLTVTQTAENRADGGAFEKTDETMEENETMDAKTLGGLVGVGLSLAFAYTPGLKDWYSQVGRRDAGRDIGFGGEENDKRNASYKQMIMGILIVAFGAVVFGLSCAGIVDFGITCDQAGAVGLAGVIGTTLVLNQAAYPLIKPRKKTAA